MQIFSPEKEADFREGDIILLDDGVRVSAETVRLIKHLGTETEIIYNLRQNKFFNASMYLSGRSWVKDVRIVRR